MDNTHVRGSFPRYCEQQWGATLPPLPRLSGYPTLEFSTEVFKMTKAPPKQHELNTILCAQKVLLHPLPENRGGEAKCQIHFH